MTPTHVYAKSRHPMCVLISICFLSLSACGKGNAEVVAQVDHNFDGEHQLYSYRATPSDELKQSEAIAQKMYGKLMRDIRSPVTSFFCVWRDPTARSLRETRPSEIFLSCSFAPTPIANPKSMIEAAEIYNATDRANLLAGWKLEGDRYVLSRFEVEIRSNKESYRSQNLQPDMHLIEVVEDSMVFPKNRNDALRFNLRSKLPRRTNSRMSPASPIVSVHFSGVAEPIPPWVNY